MIERPFWQQLAKTTGAAFLDTLDAFTTLKDTWQPYSEPGYEHFSPQGHDFFGFVVAHELLASGLVPFKTGGAVRMKAVEPPPPHPAPTPAPDFQLVWMHRIGNWKWIAAVGLGGVLVGLGIGLLLGRRNV